MPPEKRQCSLPAMTSADLEAYVARLVGNPHDQDALLAAYNASAEQPDQYAIFLETVGMRSQDPAMSAHWLFEAAGVWEQSVGDAQRSAELLVLALEKDPTNPNVGAKLAEMYRAVGDTDGLIQLLELRAAALKPLAGDESIAADYNAVLADLTSYYLSPETSNLARAVEFMQDARAASPADARLLPPLRDALKRLGRVDETLPLYAEEISLTTDPVIRPHLVSEYLDALELAGDLEGLTSALAVELQNDPTNTELQRRYAGTVHARARAGQAVPAEEAEYAAACLLAALSGRPPADALADTETALDLVPDHQEAWEAYEYACQALGIAPTRQRGGTSLPVAQPSISPTAVESSINVEGIALDFPVQAPASSMSAFQAPAYVPDPPSTNAEFARKPSSLPPPVPSSKPSARPSVPSASSSAAFAPRSESRIPAATPAPSYGSAWGSVEAAHKEAERLLHAGDRAGALAAYGRILQTHPADAEALSWVEDHLRSTRQYAELRDVLLAALRAGTQDPVELRKSRLRDVAGICESHLRDPDGAIGAWKQLLQLDPGDDTARGVLTRQLERLQRWDELAALLERQALAETDTEARMAMEKRLARIQEDKRGDVLGAADAWARAARLARGDETSVERAVALYEKASRHDLAVAVLREQLELGEDVERATWVSMLADAHERAEEWRDAAPLRLEIAEQKNSARTWEDLERVADLAADRELAARAAKQRAELSASGVERALWLARAASQLAEGGRHDEATAMLKLAGEADLSNDEIATLYDARLEAAGQHASRIEFFEHRAGAQTDTALRASTLTRAAILAAEALGDASLAKRLFEASLAAQPSRGAYVWLADAAAKAGDPAEESKLLRSALPTAANEDDADMLTLRLAATLSDVLSEHAEAAKLLAERSKNSKVPARILGKLAEVYERDGKRAEALVAVGEHLKVAAASERRDVALHMARLAKETGNTAEQIVALEALVEAGAAGASTLLELADAYHATDRSEEEEKTLAALELVSEQSVRPEVALRRARIFEQLGRRENELDVLRNYADEGHVGARAAWVRAADGAGKKSLVAERLYAWWANATDSADRTHALEDAMHRYHESGDKDAALNVARSLLSVSGISGKALSVAEKLAADAHDNLLLDRAHRAIAEPLAGLERAEEFVRQAELRSAAGWDVSECVSHAEQGLSAAGTQGAGLLPRIAKMLDTAADRVAVYERQALRAITTESKVEALANASHYALSQGEQSSAKSFLDTALALSPSADTCAALELSAQEADRGNDASQNVRALVASLSDAGSGLRDGGAFRSEALRHAAELARRTLGDKARSWTLLGESLSASPSDDNLKTLRSFESEDGDGTAAADALRFALGGVFDANQSRTLLLESARVKRERMNDAKGAAEDLRAAYDLAPADAALWSALTSTLREAGDFRGLVSAYEDRLVRERDTATRQEFARIVARIWSDDLVDAREAADAWRRLLRLAPGDAEAQSGLEKARGSLVGNPSVPPPASLRARPTPPNLEALRVTPAAPSYEALPSSQVLPDNAPSVPPPAAEEASVDALGRSAEAVVAQADEEIPLELQSVEEIEELDALEDDELEELEVIES